MEGTSAFSSEDDVTKKTIDTVSKPSTEADKLGEVYEVDRCREWIQKNGLKKVALQFPDERLVDSVPVQANLQRALAPSAAVFILGDTSYGSCCVDEVAAEHYQADSVIHFGPTCLSPTQRLSVLHVLCSQPVDVADAAQQIHSLVTSSSSPGGDCSCRLIIMADTMYQHAVEPLAERLRAAEIEAVESYLQLPSLHPTPSTDIEGTPTTTTPTTNITKTPSTTPSATTTSATTITHRSNDTTEVDTETNTKKDDSCWHCQCNRKFRLPAGCSSSLENISVCYIGGEGRALTNLMMTMNKSQFLSYDPESKKARRETLNVNRELMKRYYMIERAKEARIVGVVAGTLGVSRTREIIAHLKSLAKGAGKKTYTFVVGKLNVPKLANFMEVDVFVLVACPLNTLLDSKDFLKPVITPFEMEVACNQAREWTGQYITDFIQLLPGAADHIAAVAAEEDAVDVSLISNKLVNLGQRSSALLAKEGQESSALIARSDAMALTSVSANTAGEFLSSRSWQGLDRQLGQTAVEKAKEGRSGIAMGYQNEPQ